jgi:hypothetical protein
MVHMFWYSPNQPKEKKPEDHIPGEPEEVLPAKDNDFSKDHRSREMIIELGLLYHYAFYLLQTSKQASTTLNNGMDKKTNLSISQAAGIRKTRARRSR